MFHEIVNKVFDKIMWVVITCTWVAFIIDMTVQYVQRQM